VIEVEFKWDDGKQSSVERVDSVPRMFERVILNGEEMIVEGVHHALGSGYLVTVVCRVSGDAF
jgi:hypothetical protein